MNLKMSSIYYCDAIVILLILLGFRSRFYARFKERYTRAGLDISRDARKNVTISGGAP